MDENTLTRLTALMISVLPAMVMFAYFMVVARVSFRVEKLWSAFAFGAVIAFPCILLGQFFNWLIDLGTDPLALSLKKSIFMAAIPEELLKLVAVLILCGDELSEIKPRRLFMMAVACGCGFACFENILYVFEVGHWQTTAIQRSLSAVPGHAFVSALMGYCIYRAVHRRAWWWGLVVIVPIACHGAYDFFLFATSNLSQAGYSVRGVYWMTWGFIACVVFEGLMAHIVLQKLIKEEQSDDLPLGEGEEWHSRLDQIANAPFFWAITGGLSLIGTIYFTYDMRGKVGTLEVVFNQGFAVFSLLHALAFLVLMLIQLRRANRGQSPW